MCKKILSLVLCLILVVGTGAPGSATGGTTGQITVTFKVEVGEGSFPGDATEEKKSITFPADGSSVNYTLPATNPTREGYDFVGWFSVKGSGGQKIDATTDVTNKQDHTVYARWKAKLCTITYDWNYKTWGITDTEPTELTAKEVAYDSQFGDAVKAPDTIPTGYTFDGWFDSATGGTKVKDTDICKNTNGIELFAHWTPVILNVTCDFNYPEGAVVTASPAPAAPKFEVIYNETYGGLDGQPVAGAVPLGYKFAKWTTEKDGKGDVRTKDSPVKITADETLYAQWERTHYVVSLDYCQVARPENAPEHVLYATPKPDASVPTTRADPPEPPHPNYSDEPLPSPTATGYTFLGWAKDAKKNGDGVFVVDEKTPVVGTTDEVKGDHTLYAKWQGSQHTVTFNLNYTPAPSSTPAPVKASYGTKLGTLLPTTAPTRSGYQFLGWYTDPTGGEAITNVSSRTVQGDVTLHAHWIAANTVQLELNGGTLPSGTSSSVVVSEGNPWPKLPDPTREGYQFEGWYTSNTEGVQISGGTGAVEAPIPTTLYARWTAKKFQVKFDYNGGDGSQDPKAYTYGEKYSRLPSNAQWPGHTFLGWYTAASGGTLVNGETLMTTASDHTLYARWGFQVSFEPGIGFGEMENQIAIVGEDYILPECGFTAPEGMSFTNWAVGTARGEKFPAGTRYTIARNTTLYAVWETSPIYITATSSSGGTLTASGGGSGQMTFEQGSDVTFIPRANRGYQLADLVIDGESCGPMKSYTFQNLTEDHTIHAVFELTPPPSYSTCDHGRDCPLSKFSDLQPNAWYHDAVHYCMDQVLMNGTGGGRYSPSAKADRATLVTVLWQAAGCPYSPTTGSLSKPFKDVSSRAWYYKPVCWALHNGITSGYSNGNFGPNDRITREQVVTMLWQYAGRPDYTINRMPYVDTWAVSDYAWNAMLWATENQIISGKENNRLDPKGYASRAEIAQMIMGFMKFTGEV